MIGDILRVVPLPEYMRVYAEYEGDGTNPNHYERIYFVGIVEYAGDPETDCAFLSFSEDGIFQPVDAACNFIQIHVIGEWYTERLPSCQRG